MDKKIGRQEALRTMAMGTMGLAWSGVAAGMHASAFRGTIDKHSAYRDWNRSALVVVDMQNDFVRAGAPLEVPDARLTIPAQRSLIEAYRRKKLPVIFTKFISRPHYYLLWEWSPQCKPPVKCCWKEHQRKYQDLEGSRECTDVIDELTPLPEDTIIEKYGYGAFHDTSLHHILSEANINTLVITGTVTQICVEETAREAFHHGYRTTLAADGVSSFAPDLHAATLKNFGMKFGWVSEAREIVAHLKQG